MRSRGRTVNSGRYSYLLARPALFPLFSWFPFWSLGEHTHTQKSYWNEKENKSNPNQHAVHFAGAHNPNSILTHPVLLPREPTGWVGSSAGKNTVPRYYSRSMAKFVLELLH